MNRRTFLKSIATACGAAVVCPGELLKPVQPKLKLEPGWYDIEILSEADRKKYCQNILIKARQQGITIIYDEFATRRDEMFKAYQGEYY